MNPPVLQNEAQAQLLKELIDCLSKYDLCLEIRHYPLTNERDEKLHLLIILQREITQNERHQFIDELNTVAGRNGAEVDCLFSSPKVWRDLKTLISPFTRIDRESIIDWQRQEYGTTR